MSGAASAKSAGSTSLQARGQRHRPAGTVSWPDLV
jgi:hypothetical protein